MHQFLQLIGDERALKHTKRQLQTTWNQSAPGDKGHLKGKELSLFQMLMRMVSARVLKRLAHEKELN
jgi:hypothetical protein